MASRPKKTSRKASEQDRELENLLRSAARKPQEPKQSSRSHTSRTHIKT
jgi:hypothetical protein